MGESDGLFAWRALASGFGRRQASGRQGEGGGAAGVGGRAGRPGTGAGGVLNPKRGRPFDPGLGVKGTLFRRYSGRNFVTCWWMQL